MFLFLLEQPKFLFHLLSSTIYIHLHNSLQKNSLHTVVPNYLHIQDSFVQGFYYDYKGCSKGSFIIDKTDFDLIKDYTWSKTNQGYFVCNKLDITLHDFLVSPQEDYEVDHVNRLRFDNRRVNLKLCTRSENQYNRNIQSNNTSGLIGVNYSKKNKNWRGRLKNGQIDYCEAFPTKLEAAIYRRKLELEYSRYFLRPELEEYLLENISDENLLKELELIFLSKLYIEV